MAKSKAFDKSKYQNWIDPNAVKPYERNAKIHDEKQVKNIANSIKRFGWQQDVVITRDNVLVIGHGRRLAAIQLGCEMPYHMIDKDADDLTDDDIRELRLVDNMTNESAWDFDLKALESLELDFEGFDFIDISEDEKGETEAKKKFEEMQLRQFEHHDYIVFVFDNQMDWLTAVTKFGLRKVDAGYGKTKKVGLGRVLDGKELLRKVVDTDFDIVEGTF